MAEKHLRELLLEDQEPFLLKHYISERRSLLKTASPNTTLTKNTSNSNSNFPLNKCLLSFHNATKSPLSEFAPPTKNHTPLRPSNAKTATLLLEAALRIHKHTKPKPNRAFGIFGSLFKKLRTQRKRGQINDDVVAAVGVVGSCEGRPSSSGVWSESNEDKSLDMETCSSAHSFDDSVEQEIQFLNTRKLNSHDLFFCQTPFRFSLRHSPDYSPRRTPEFSSPLASPRRHTTQDNEVSSGDGVNKFQPGKEEEEEDKEQCSPVSVLDPPFDDDDAFDLDCSYANVQRTTQNLLDRLRRFEKLAELDPVELEKRMLEQEDETFMEEDDEKKVVGESVVEILSDSQEAGEDLKRLVYDLIMEEETGVNCSEERNTVVMRRVCRRLELWKEVECNTIDMMIEEDFCREEGRWKKNGEHRGELVQEVEFAIFCYLMEELSEELVCC
ncbi:hypothetical protein DEO72_LG9g944 [Vigna unguiculata]|uniref:DUF4378 domain-containing protein n=1 Tax=Vigna unguiculata TaxID=3917 RepID=A0A4D6N1I6_VIGUN|nr:hypothetical protein DEO72_LG9g944 [Vigna unguiculata]